MGSVLLKWYNLRLLISACLLAGSLHAQVTITGTFKNPDSTSVTGAATISINYPTINNYCSTPYQVLVFRPVRVAINSGSLASLSLLAGPCMVSQVTPAVQPGAGAGKGATASLTTGKDLQATVSLTTGTTPNNTSPALTITFAGGPYVPAPSCIVNGPTGSNTTFLSTKSALQITATLSASTIYSFSYYCQVMPYLVKITNQYNQLLYSGNWIVPNQGSADVSVLDPR